MTGSIGLGAMAATRSTGRPSVPRALVDICRGSVPEVGPGAAFAGELVTAVRHHRIAPLAHALLRDHEPALAARLRPDRDAAIAMHLRSASGLVELSRLLDGVPWATFKGPVLSDLAHPVPGLRTYRDLDVLVAPGSLREVAARFHDAGWQVADYRDTLRLPEVRGEMHWRTGTGLMVDLHWSMLNMAQDRRLFEVPTDALLMRRTPRRLSFAETCTLDPVDAFVHVCLHAAMTGADRMQHLLDIDQLARTVQDWDAVVGRARQWRVATPVQLVLRRTGAVLGSSVPPAVDRQLGRPPGLGLVTGITDRLLPVQRLRREASFPRLVSRSAGPGTAATYAALVTKSAKAMTSRVPYRRGTTVDVAPADPASVELYLSRVEEECARSG